MYKKLPKKKYICHYYLKIFKKNVTARLAGPKCVVIGSRSAGATVFHPSQQFPKLKHFRHPLVAGPAEPAKSYQTPRRQQYQCHTEKIIEVANLCCNAKFPPCNNKCVRYSGQRKKGGIFRIDRQRLFLNPSMRRAPCLFSFEQMKNNRTKTLIPLQG